jgi:hypothetical protein
MTNERKRYIKFQSPFFAGNALRIQAGNSGESMIQQRQYAGKPAAASSFAQVLKGAEAGKNAGAGAGGDIETVGVISKEHPTVSDLLVSNPRFSKDTWKIIHAERNAGKNYAGMRPGTRVLMNRQTGELFWETGDRAADSRTARPALQEAPSPFPPVPAAAAVTPAGAPQGLSEKKPEQAAAGTAAGQEEYATPGQEAPAPFSAGLAQAVRHDLGRPYRDIDCYGLVVRGLSRMGVRYGGRGGLQDQLVQMAKSRGLPANAYMTGEGLVEASGEKVFARSLDRVGNVEKEADRIFTEMAPFLQKGDILSFSTPTRGHTGVISQHKEMWTFINSGYMDNRIDRAGRSRGVGEEDLAREIKNWCRVAARNGESLVITLGRLQEEKVAAMAPSRYALASGVSAQSLQASYSP